MVCRLLIYHSNSFPWERIFLKAPNGLAQAHRRQTDEIRANASILPTAKHLNSNPGAGTTLLKLGYTSHDFTRR